MAEEIPAGFGYGLEHPVMQAVLAEIAAFRESAIEDGKAAEKNRAVWRAVGAMEKLDDLKAKLIGNVQAVQGKLEEEAREADKKG